jgi:uncharacterized membrane protein YdcZ (DUF606 family)
MENDGGDLAMLSALICFGAGVVLAVVPLFLTTLPSWLWDTSIWGSSILIVFGGVITVVTVFTSPRF